MEREVLRAFKFTLDPTPSQAEALGSRPGMPHMNTSRALVGSVLQ